MAKIEIKNIIGSGGFGNVYMGHYHLEKYHTQYTKVAIKKLDSPIDSTDGIPFLMELSIMQMSNKSTKKDTMYLNNSLDILIMDNSIYIVQPLALYNLNEHITHNALGFEKKLTAIKHITKGMLYLHSLGIAHLDIKPSNVLVFDGFNPFKPYKYKLSDFGISSFLHNTSNRKVCTSIYRPPEGWEVGINITPCIDYWSLGCVVYYITYEKHLFTKKTKKEFFQILKGLIKNLTLLDKNNINASILSLIKYNSSDRNIEEFCKRLGIKSVNTTVKTKDIIYSELHNKVQNIGYHDDTVSWILYKMTNRTKESEYSIPLYRILLEERSMIKSLNYCLISD